MSQCRENELARIVVDACYQVHREFGPGLFESVYEVVLVQILRDQGLSVNTQVDVPVRFRGLIISQGFRADVIVENVLLLELKSVEKLGKVSYKQVLTYLKLTEIRLGLLINFGEEYIKDGIKRIVNGLPED